MARSGEQTTGWVAGNISKMPQVHEAAVIGPNSIRITRDDYEPFVAGIISTPLVTAGILQPLFDSDSTIEIAVNVPKESIWTGTAIALSVMHSAAFGGVSDLMSAISHENVREYVRPEYKFVERGLNQHNRVSGLERRFDRVYQIHRHELPSLCFVMLNEYELTADHVRTARCRYGAFDAILINNPNGRATGGALETAQGIGIGIFKWREFLSRLNSK
jgi:hypothetical protein